MVLVLGLRLEFHLMIASIYACRIALVHALHTGQMVRDIVIQKDYFSMDTKQHLKKVFRVPMSFNSSNVNTCSSLNCTNASTNTSQNDSKWILYLYIFVAILGALEALLILIGWW
jgi:hypothetical protein